MKRIIFVILIVVALYQTYQYSPKHINGNGLSPVVAETKGSIAQSALLARAYQDKLSNIQVAGNGRVVKVLADDTKGSRHQKFILKLASGQTLLVAHNIDLAPRLKGLQTGDRVGFYGEYEWNNLGGILHWTHHDPAGRHIGGWLEYDGQRYQ